MVGYEGPNQWRIYNPLTKKVHISRDVNFDEGFAYDASLNEDAKAKIGEFWSSEDDEELALEEKKWESEIISNNNNQPELGEFWSPEDDEQLAFEEKEWESKMISKARISDAVGVRAKARENDIEGSAVRGLTELERDIDSDAESFLTTLDNEPLIPSQPKSPPMTGSFPPDKDDDEVSTPKVIRKPRRKAPPPPPTDRETRAMTGSSKPRLRYMNNIASSHCHMHKVLNALQSGDYLGLTKAQEPQSYKAALVSPEALHWKKAIQSEYDSLIENQTWELTDLPPDRKVLTGRWVFRLKYGLDGEIRKFKARWVVHGHKQKYGINYNETWVGVVKPASFQSLFSIGVSRNLHIKQMDVVTAFLYGLLDKVVYVDQSHVFV